VTSRTLQNLHDAHELLEAQRYAAAIYELESFYENLQMGYSTPAWQKYEADNMTRTLAPLIVSENQL
jgi:hypothetical protein